MRISQSVLGFLLCILVTACGNKPHVPSQSLATDAAQKAQAQHVVASLLAGYSEWQGVPHRDGGLSKKGVDCSGFTYLTFRDLFGVQLPRTTSQLAQTGSPIPKGQLQPGDLVFFKVEKGRHVGIYVENQKFIHASKSKGVMMSRLDNPYWQGHYWQARRVAAL
ncbi:MAG: C40 family peptidase [Proteobacteria bacterium]|nr:C40 family peptidase [Pseudomonadota bacterium]